MREMPKRPSPPRPRVTSFLDPLYPYPEMMSPQDVAEFANISADSALQWMKAHGGVIVIPGRRNVWRIAKEYVRKGFNLPQIVG